MILDNHLSEHLKRTRTKTIDRICQLHPLLSNSVLNPKTGILLYKLHICRILHPHRIPRASRPSQNDADLAEIPIQRRRPGGVPRQTEQDFLREILPSTETAITQKIWGTTKHRTVTEALRKL
ncbi:hypothetical protein Trydic_g16568 [Trypoxylus dichotomus]